MKEKLPKEEKQKLIDEMERLAIELNEIVHTVEDYARQEDVLVCKFNELYQDMMSTNVMRENVKQLLKWHALASDLIDFDLKSMDITKRELKNLELIEAQKEAFKKYIHGNTSASKLYLGTFTEETISNRRKKCQVRMSGIKHETDSMIDILNTTTADMIKKWGMNFIKETEKILGKNSQTGKNMRNMAKKLGVK